jgi:exopolysaccharide biosynthesis polyprenyl glycosylphosphotransferase
MSEAQSKLSLAPVVRGSAGWPQDNSVAVIPRTRDPLRRRLLAVADAFAATAAVGAFTWLGGGPAAFAWGMLALPVWILLAKLHGLYDRDHRCLRHLTADELPSIFLWTVSGTAVTLLLLIAAPTGRLGLGATLGALFAAAGAAVVGRSVARAAWRRLVAPERTVIVGVGALADATRRKLELFPDIHIDVLGERDERDLLGADDYEWLRQADRVVLASHSISEDVLAELLVECRRRGVRLSVVPPARGMFGTAVHLSHVAELPVIEYNTWDVSRSTLLLKRALDVVVALVTLALFAPVFVLAAVAVKLSSPGSIFFVQWRAGEGGRPFRMYKFRTMCSDAEQRLDEFVSLDELAEPVFKLRGDPRVTRVGALLRRTSVDELPQLVNVLKGDMSLVGPRPEQVEVVDRYAEEHLFRLAIKPGITGPMQVYGRGELSFEERLAVEREYIENLSLARDIRILVLTFSAVAHGRGAF